MTRFTLVIAAIALLVGCSDNPASSDSNDNQTPSTDGLKSITIDLADCVETSGGCICNDLFDSQPTYISCSYEQDAYTETGVVKVFPDGRLIAYEPGISVLHCIYKD